MMGNVFKVNNKDILFQCVFVEQVITSGVVSFKQIVFHVWWTLHDQSYLIS